MQTAFFKSICQVGIFMVCAQTITHFRPNSSYEKYMKLLVSVMVLIQILQPMSSLLRRSGGKNLEERVLQFQGQFDEGMADAMENISQSEKILENMTLREVQELLKQQEEEAAGQREEMGQKEQIEQGKETAESQEEAEGIEKVQKITIGLD